MVLKQDLLRYTFYWIIVFLCSTNDTEKETVVEIHLDQDHKEAAEEVVEQEESNKDEVVVQEVEKIVEDAATTRPKRSKAGLKMSKLGDNITTLTI